MLSSPNAARACPSCPTPSAGATSRRWALSDYNAAVLTAEVETARWFEALLAETAAAQGKSDAEVAKQAANWLISEFFGALNKGGHSLED